MLQLTRYATCRFLEIAKGANAKGLTLSIRTPITNSRCSGGAGTMNQHSNDSTPQKLRSNVAEPGAIIFLWMVV